MTATFGVEESQIVTQILALLGEALVIKNELSGAGTIVVTGKDGSSAPIQHSVTVTGTIGSVLPAMSEVTSIQLASSASGSVSLQRVGRPATSSLAISQPPVDGDQIEIGFSGHTEIYTFVDNLTGAPANSVLCDVVADPLSPLPSTTAAEAMLSIDDGGTVDVDVDDTIAGAPAALTAYGADYADAYVIARDTACRNAALRLQDAINADPGGAGVTYSASTVAHAYVEATDVDGKIMLLAGRLACNHGVLTIDQLLSPAGTFDISQGLTGADGEILATLTAGDSYRTGSLVMGSEDLSLFNLPRQTIFVSDWVSAGGRRATIYIKASNMTTAMDVDYQLATDKAHPFPWTAMTALDNNAYTFHVPDGCIEHIRIRINNTNTAAAAVCAKMVY